MVRASACSGKTAGCLHGLFLPDLLLHDLELVLAGGLRGLPRLGAAPRPAGGTVSQGKRRGGCDWCDSADAAGFSLARTALRQGQQFGPLVWRALLEIPAGETTSYKSIAEQVRTPKAARAVGAAVGANPVAWLIPCHRVIAADGQLTGYHWGVERKRAMLAYEAAAR